MGGGEVVPLVTRSVPSLSPPICEYSKFVGVDLPPSPSSKAASRASGDDFGKLGLK